MNRTMKQRKLPGVPCPEERVYELHNKQIARVAATEGMVLLKNENAILPIPKGTAVALYGAGAAHTIKGGTGSGDVNSRGTVSILEGLTNAGYRIVTKRWLDAYDEAYEAARAQWRDAVWQKEARMRETDDSGFPFFFAYSETPFVFPVGDLPEKEDAEIAVYVLSRQAGEGKDRINGGGDFVLSEQEAQIIERMCALYPHVVLVLNTGGIIDLSFADRYPNIEAILYMHQPGMEAGNALADLFCGDVVPSGKLTDSWPCAYADYPNASVFSHNNGNVEKEAYVEGIYVGYRYFDTFAVPVRYCFGYGLSYADFAIETGDRTFQPGNAGAGDRREGADHQHWGALHRQRGGAAVRLLPAGQTRQGVPPSRGLSQDKTAQAGGRRGDDDPVCGQRDGVLPRGSRSMDPGGRTLWDLCRKQPGHSSLQRVRSDGRGGCADGDGTYLSAAGVPGRTEGRCRAG